MKKDRRRGPGGEGAVKKDRRRGPGGEGAVKEDRRRGPGGEGAVKDDPYHSRGGEGAVKDDRLHGRGGEGAVVLKADRRRRSSGVEAVKEDRHLSRGGGGVVVVKDDRHGADGRKSRRRGTPGEAPAGAASPLHTNGNDPATDQPGGVEIDAAAGTSGKPDGRIRTEAGRYLRAIADDDEAKLGTADGQVDDETRRVWANAFGLAARRRFDPDAPLAEISRTVAAAVHDHAAVALPALETEMLVRAALGERVPADEIDHAVLTAVHLLLFVSLTDELALAGPELDTLIAEAEAG